MNSNKNFVASLIAAVGSFVALPLAFYWFFVGIEELGDGFNFLMVALMALFVLAVAVLAMETVALILGDKLGKVYNIITIVLNALFVVLSIVALVFLIIDFGMFDFEVFVILCMYFLPVFFAAAANGVACGFKLFDIFKK